MEIGGCYAVNLWCDAPELANKIEAFLTTRNITSYRTWEHFSGGISLGYTVNVPLAAGAGDDAVTYTRGPLVNR